MAKDSPSAAEALLRAVQDYEACAVRLAEARNEPPALIIHFAQELNAASAECAARKAEAMRPENRGTLGAVEQLYMAAIDKANRLVDEANPVVEAALRELAESGEEGGAIVFSLRGRGEDGEREVEAEVMGDGDVVPSLTTGGGGSGHRFVAVWQWATRKPRA
ncbi:hypothetical protein CR162_14925 [Pseudoroseomonas rhizosphaerae]|uniref:Uncharacterized protein n=1 Tax=Teichococcus rhizosphaerae TaxID=1335062 RepID=A0A2C6Z6D9_9PROT|nr:hypothetical protein [Pseudoroseomonas rhizosphaerae]PHK94061.1 hypothetical protein CR162_14925 [Pseudoroseomonas rhizosphaerae]